MDQIGEIKQKLNIVDIIGSYIPLKKAGRNYKANCPFHGEKTPSFMVSSELQIYKCFGCGETGDVISFLEKYEKMEFSEALETLATKAGVTLVKTNQTGNEKEVYFKLNELVGKYYSYMLLEHPVGRPALKYLTETRGLKIDTIKNFHLGFSPMVSRTLYEFLTRKKKVKEELLEKGGLMYRTKDGMIDRFNGRVIFPLFDHRGNTIGFAGRLLPQDKRETGKYINSPETPVYHKSDVLYGLNWSKDEIKNKKEAIIVEGELDLISSWQQCFKNLVAIKGTALTQGHISLLKRFTDKIVLSLDADIAGDTAARRGIALAFNSGLEVRVVELKNYKDPDEIVRSNPQLFEKLIRESISVWDFLIESVFNKYNLENPNEKAKISREVTPIISSIEDKIMQAHYMNVVAKKLGVPLDAVSEEVSKAKPEFIKEDSQNLSKEETPKSRRDLLENEFLSLLIQKDPALLKNQEIKEVFSSHGIKRIIEEISKEDSFEISEFSKKLSPELLNIFSEIILKSKEFEDEETKDEEYERLLNQLRVMKVKEDLAQISGKMRLLEDKNDTEGLQLLTEEFAKASKLLVELEKNH